MKKSLSILLLVMGMFLGASPAWAYTWGLVYDTDGYTYIRQGPDVDFELTKWMQYSGEPVCLGEKVNKWYKVYGWRQGTQQFIGYMAASRIKFAPKGCSIYRIEDRDGYVNVRKGASTSYGIATKITSGSYVFAGNASGDWYRVYNELGKYLGYVHNSRLVKVSSITYPKREF